MDGLKNYYETFDEEGRLLSRHGQVEYLTTRKYIPDCAEKSGAKRILEIGAGTGRYSVPLSREGFDVTAVDLFRLYRTEDIAAPDETVPADRVVLPAADGAANYMPETVDAMDDGTFEKWMEYHLTVCERQDLIGASHHTPDILKKR